MAELVEAERNSTDELQTLRIPAMINSKLKIQYIYQVRILVLVVSHSCQKPYEIQAPQTWLLI
ncbi:hypothetical protein ES288_D03G191000v1 [Gossypium darwinii]|uniref:Uncharacterized protein n=1 Tax=Gossypium darwinii TaxID=34276 RepID=A0A5D2D725_GOSDA|nr:hypothetical protein ES288_D03G191000v1 [Gossypium darwinii]